jgi:hypothetical protein
MALTPSAYVLPLIDPSAHNISRQEIVHYIQLYITAVLRQNFLRGEMEKEENVHLRKTNDNSTEPHDAFVPDMIQITQNVNRMIQSYRSFIKKQAFFFENILYKRAVSMEEYYNLEDLEDRLDEVGRILNRRMMMQNIGS